MRNIIVTGASTGIGRATSIAFAKEGANILLVARRENKLEETKRLVIEAGGTAESFICDLSDILSINKFISLIKVKYKQIDGLINIAGIWHGDGIVYAEKDYETFDQKVILDTYMVGTIAPSLLAHAVIPLMPQNGKIVNLSGTFQTGAKGWLPYYVSKRAIEDLTVGLSEELKEKNICVNCVSPSDTATDAYKHYFQEYIPDAVQPEEIAKQIVFLASEKANDITGKVFVVMKDKEPFESFHF